MNTGVYAIEHLASGRRYIGSAVHFERRWNVHRHHLRRGVHHSPHLQSAWRKHGESAFAFRRVLVCAPRDLLLYEQICMDHYRAADRERGFNTVARAGSQLGLKHSEETRQKIRAKRAAQTFSAETRAKWSANRRGRKMPDWFPAFVSKQMRGKAVSAETRVKLSAVQKGQAKPRSEVEARSKLTYEKAVEIRTAYAMGSCTHNDLAKRYGVHQTTIHNVLSGKHWRVRNELA